MDKIQDRLYIDINDRKIIDEIEKDGILNFKDSTNKEIFLLAMSIGHYYGLTDLEIQKKDGYFLTKDLSITDYSILNCIAIDFYNDIEVVNDINKVFEYSQRCAHGGFRILKDTIDTFNYVDKDKKFIMDIFEVYEKININNKEF